jgi:undecaprenyl-diphosphatase
MRLPSLGRHALLFCGALAVLALALAFTLVASEVREGDTQGFDRAFLVALRTPGDPADALGPAWIEDWMRDITALGSAAVLILMTAAAVGFLAFRKQFHAVGLVLASMLGGIGVSTLLKGIFMRTRPDLVAVPEHLSTSFPSGHSMMSAVAYLTLGLILSRFVKPLGFKVYVISVAAILTFLVGFSRMFLAVHYPSDVLAGWIAGLAWAGLCFLLAEWLQGRGAVEKEQ